NGAQEYFIVKYSPNGIPLWAQSAGGANWDNGNGVTLDKDGGVYAIGNFSTDITFGAFTLHNISPGTYDAFMVKYDPYGAVLWAQSAGGTSNDTPNDVAVSHDKSAYITGYYSSPTMSFGNQTITNLGNSTNDVFLAKYYACSDVNELNICLVTTDTLGQYNIVYWDNPHIKSIDSILVYRFDIVSNGYLQIGAVSGDSLSQFTDTAFSIGGPNGGNPQYSSWQYKIAVRDTCGNISMKSPYHQSIFIQENGSNFSWNSYFIEAGQTNPITGYQFQRDDNNTGNWHVLVNTSGLSSTDPNHTLYPNGNWRVDALGFNCIPTTLRLANNNNNNNTDAAKVRSHSNQNNNRMSGIKQVQPNNNYVAIYPNPAKDNFTIEPSLNEKQTLQIFDVSGKMVLTQVIDGKVNIDTHNLNEGVYNVSVSGNGGQTNKKLVILR
ncbi:MAG TPA: T9SS type A sorting domain-containing protein, partial [Bacteroidia bacterium]|nr:T9SS type A sorting domain-containing protein [Bacteroidia bacterium]